MAQYRIVINATAANIQQVRKKTLEAFGADISTQIEKVERNPTRQQRLEEAESLLSDAHGIVEELRDEIQEWHDNLPEGIQNSDKGSELDDCVSALDELASEIDNIDFGNVTFPSAF